MHRETYQFDLTNQRHTSVKSFTLREIGAAEETEAIGHNPDGGRALEEYLWSLSITAVDGEEVQHPYQGWKSWNSRTLDFLRIAFARINGTTEEERGNFLATALGE